MVTSSIARLALTKAVIERGSCAACEKVTSYLDGYLARRIFNEYRAHTGMKSRRPKQRPKKLPATVIKRDGTEEIRLFDAKEVPHFLMMPVWHLPGIVRGKTPTADFEIMQAHAYWYIPESMRNPHEMEWERVKAQGTINYTAFARAIARISYCNAVIHLGLDGFDHLDVPGLILGRYPYVPHYVGVDRSDPPPPTPHGQLHEVKIQTYNAGGIDYWIVSLRLFSHSGFQQNGMPVYRTVVGKPLVSAEG